MNGSMHPNAINARHRRDYAAKVKRGECIHCPEKARPGRTTCKSCGAIRSLRTAKRKARLREHLKALGICVKCEQREAIQGPKHVLQCAYCLEHHTEHAVDKRAEWRKKHLCPRCGRKPKKGFIRCEVCHAKARKPAAAIAA